MLLYLWHKVCDGTLSLVALHEWVYNDIGLWWQFYNHIRHKLWFLTCLPSVISPVHLRFCLLCFFSNPLLFLLFNSQIFYLLVAVLFWHLFLTIIPSRTAERCSAKKCCINTTMSVRRRMLHAGVKVQLPACQEAVYQEASFWRIRSKRTASRPKPNLKN